MLIFVNEMTGIFGGESRKLTVTLGTKFSKFQRFKFENICSSGKIPKMKITGKYFICTFFIKHGEIVAVFEVQVFVTILLLIIELFFFFFFKLWITS